MCAFCCGTTLRALSLTIDVSSSTVAACSALHAAVRSRVTSRLALLTSASTHGLTLATTSAFYSPRAENFVTGLIQCRPQKPQQTGQDENRRGRSGGWWGGRGEGGGGWNADKLTNKAILSQNRVSPPRKIRFFGGGFRIVLSELPPPGHGPPAHSSPSPPTVRTRLRLKKSNRTEL